MKIALTILAIIGLAGAAYAVVKGASGGTVAVSAVSGTPVNAPTTGTALQSPAPSNQTGVTEVPIDAATTQIASAGRGKKKKKK